LVLADVANVYTSLSHVNNLACSRSQILEPVYVDGGLLEDSLQHDPLDKAVPSFFLKGGVWSSLLLQNCWAGKHVGAKVEVGDLTMDITSHKLISVLHFLVPLQL
jgi:hypothetical protein